MENASEADKSYFDHSDFDTERKELTGKEHTLRQFLNENVCPRPGEGSARRMGSFLPASDRPGGAAGCTCQEGTMLRSNCPKSPGSCADGIIYGA